MKTAKKSLAILLAVIMVLALSATAFAANTSITVNNAVKDQTYKAYQLFDATVDGTKAAYTTTKSSLTAGGIDGTTWFTLGAPDSNGVRSVTAKATFTEDVLKSNDNFKTWAMAFGTQRGGDQTANGTDPVVFSNVPVGYYYVTSSMGSLVSVDTTNSTVNIREKNSPPVHTKEITGTTDQYVYFDADGKNAIAQLGKQVEFTNTITVGKGASDYIFHDTMISGLTYDSTSLVVTNATGYTISPTATGDTLTVYLPDGLAEGTVVTIKYKATVNSNALTTNFEKNTANVEYGNNGSETPPQETKIYDAKITVTKKIGSESGNPLENAGFVLKNSAGQYYKKDAETVSWYTLGSNETLAAAIAAGKVTEYKSNASGAVPAFTGLANGTYKLEESTVPAGYNKAPDKEVTINGGDYTAANLELTPTVVNQAGTVLPSTGGVGTTIFYVLGSCLLLGAAVLMITRKRMGREG